MKKVITSILMLCIVITVFGQSEKIQSQQIKYTRLDQIQKVTNPLFGNKRANIEFNLISLQNLMNDSTVYGVEVNLSTEKNKILSTSIALGNLGSLWGSSVNATTKTIKKEGYKFLTYNDLKTINEFMNKAVSLRGRKAKNYIIYKLTLSDKIQIGMKYDPEIANVEFSQKFNFIITVEDATYITSYKDGMEIMQKLNDYRVKLNELE